MPQHLVKVRHFQGRGIGVGLLQDAIRRAILIAEHAGIRAMLTHPSTRTPRSSTPASALLLPRCESNSCCCSSKMRGAG
jgi:hypothetical protein